MRVPSPIVTTQRMTKAPYLVPAMQTYPLSFTAASLRPRESQLLAARYRELGNWEEVYAAINGDPLFGQRKEASVRRTFNELTLRLDTLATSELAQLAEGDPTTVRLLLWQAVCRAYPFIGRFVEEVVYPKVRRLDYHLLESDYRSYLREQSERHPRLLELTDSTRDKLRSRLLRIMVEAGLLDNTTDRNLQIPAVPRELYTCDASASPALSRDGRAQKKHTLHYWLLTETADCA